jgi:hypothetical protein
MKIKALALTLITALLFSFFFCSILVLPVESQSVETIFIKADGSVEGTDKIQRQGNVYTLTDDISGSIEVQKSYIVIDGAGHTLRGRKEVNVRGVYLVGPDKSHAVCGNVSVKNMRIYNFFEGIYVVGGSNNSIIGNYLDNAGIHLIANANYLGDLIKQNTFTEAGIFVDYNRGGLDAITENNFINCGIYVGLSDAPIVDRNYWSDYAEKYPDAKELGGSGIWDTPYVDDRYAEEISCIDYHPLKRPVVIPDFPDATTPTPEPSSTTSPEPNPSLTTSPLEPTPSPEIFPTTLVIGSVIAVAVIGLGFLVYLKKGKR